MIALLLMKPVCSNHTAQQYITTMFPNSPTRVATINTTIVPTTGATSTSHVVERYRDGLIGMHLLNKIEADRIDMRTVNKGENLMYAPKRRENLE